MSNVFKIIYLNDTKLYEIYAKSVLQSELFGFLEVEEILFGEHSSVLVDPAEEKLKAEFGHVIRSFIPMHNIIRIDEVPKQSTSKIREANASKTNIAQFPSQGLSGKKSIILTPRETD